MAEKNSLADILKRLREEKRKRWIERDQWTQKAVATRIGVTRQAYIAWEKGYSRPDIDHLKRIIEVFRPNEKDEIALYRAVARVPPEKKKLPPRNTLFTGRKDYLNELNRMLQPGGNAAITQAVGISGLGGIGKTQIAVEYAYQHHPDDYPTVLWVNAANQTTLQTDYDEVARRLELPERDEQDANLRVEAVKRWLDDHNRWLLIMDNADDLQLARSFMPGRLLGHIILITRSQAIRESNIAMQLIVGEMKPQEAVIFLLRRAGKWDEEGELDDEAKLTAIAADVREAATELVGLLGRYPLALDQAAAYIEAAGMPIADYIQLYHEGHQSLLDERGPPQKDAGNDHPDTVTVTVRLSFKRSCEQHAKVADVLYFCSFLQPDAMPEELFYPDSPLQLTLRSFNDVMIALRQYSLIVRYTEEKLLSMHRLVQAVLIDDMSTSLRKEWRERVAQALIAGFPQEVEFSNWRLCSRLASHVVLASITWPAGEFTPTVEFGELCHKASTYLDSRGQYSVAETLLYVVLWIYSSNFGTEHSRTASALSNLATVLCEQHRYEKAEQLYQQALVILAKAKHPDVIKALHNLATFYYMQGKYEEAEPLLIRVLSMQEELLGADHPDNAAILNVLAFLRLDQDNDEQAASLLYRAFKILKKHLEIDHPYVFGPLLGMSLLLHKLGEHEEAEAYYLRALGIIARQIGVPHSTTQWLMSFYASFLHSIEHHTLATALEENVEALE